MKKFFISYRRHDSEVETRQIYDSLVSEFGPDEVFMDVDSIPPGIDIRTYLDEQVTSCQLFLVVIGQRWLKGVVAPEKSILDDPGDFVRVEIELALKRGKPIIPILVQGANLPLADELPPTIGALAYRNATVVGPFPEGYKHVNRLISELKEITEHREAFIQVSRDRKRRTSESRPPMSAEDSLMDRPGRFADDIHEEARRQMQEVGDEVEATSAPAEAFESSPPDQLPHEYHEPQQVGEDWESAQREDEPRPPAPRLHRDRWALEDKLGYDLYAQAIEKFITHADTQAPLVIGIQAPWGQGKTTLMRMVQRHLDPDHPDLRTDRDYDRGEERGKRETALTYADLLAGGRGKNWERSQRVGGTCLSGSTLGSIRIVNRSGLA